MRAGHPAMHGTWRHAVHPSTSTPSAPPSQTLPHVPSQQVSSLAGECEHSAANGDPHPEHEQAKPGERLPQVALQQRLHSKGIGRGGPARGRLKTSRRVTHARLRTPRSRPMLAEQRTDAAQPRCNHPPLSPTMLRSPLRVRGRLAPATTASREHAAIRATHGVLPRMSSNRWDAATGHPGAAEAARLSATSAAGEGPLPTVPKCARAPSSRHDRVGH